MTAFPADTRDNEPSIAVNLNNAHQVVAAFQPAAIAYSSDSGQTFMADPQPIRGLARWRRRVGAFDNQDGVYLARLHFDKCALWVDVQLDFQALKIKRNSTKAILGMAFCYLD